MTLLSIVIPVYNSENTIGRTLDSLERMSFESRALAEVVIVNDGSEDRSMELVESKKQGLSPLNVVVVVQENMGTGAARNAGLDHSKGEWVLFLDSDDELASDPVPSILKSQDATALGYSVMLWKDMKCQRKRRPDFITMKNHLNVLTAGNGNMVSAIIFKKNGIRSFFDTGFRYMEDWLFWIMNPLIFERMKLVSDNISAVIHVHKGNKSSNYEMNGRYKKNVADKLLTEMGEILTRKQKNNLLIHSEIGRILQGGNISFKAFFLFPCNIVLYGKLIIYSVLRTNISRFDIYGP